MGWVFIEDGKIETHIPYQEIVDDLNECCHRTGRKKFRANKSTCQNIRSRYREGYGMDDFRHVHRIMAAEWLYDDVMSKYLRPSTLYRPSKWADYVTRGRDELA